ncbi:MAG: hypothetical protein ACTHJ9_18390 [Rhodanobacter sp.]
MTANDPPTEPVQDADALPRHTTPTWEVELLISGVAVFAMLQLPGWLDDRFFALVPRFEQVAVTALTLVFVYLKSAASILAITFTLHLILRAHWIALVGLHSVFPDGVHWERLRMGPVRRACEQQRLAPTTIAIERADNRATVVFALGVMLGNLMLMICLVAGVAFGITRVLHQAFDTNFDPVRSVLLFFAMVMLPFLAAHLIDRRFGSRMAATSWQRRALTWIFRTYAQIGLGRIQYAWLLVSSRIGETRFVFIIWLIIIPTATLGTLTLTPAKSPYRLGNYAAFPYLANDSRAINAAHYDDQRDLAHDPAVPYIQSAVIDTSYLQLVVPYQPDSDGAAMKRECAAAPALADPQARAKHALDCLGKLHAVTLDGKPLPELRYETGTDARARRPALVAMIDVRALAPGRHELRVMRAPTATGRSNSRDAIDEYVIPFWR